MKWLNETFEDFTVKGNYGDYTVTVNGTEYTAELEDYDSELFSVTIDGTKYNFYPDTI